MNPTGNIKVFVIDVDQITALPTDELMRGMDKLIEHIAFLSFLSLCGVTDLENGMTVKETFSLCHALMDAFMAEAELRSASVPEEVEP